MLPRILEPEVMDTAEDAADYDSMDHSEVNRRFVEHWGMACRSEGLALDAPLKMLDVGTGTARIPIEFCRRFPQLKINAIDLATEMLQLAAINVEQAGLGDRIELQLIDAKQIPSDGGTYESVVSNTIIHHIPEPWSCLSEMVRMLAPGGLLFVRDLMRPETDAEVESLVETHAHESTPRQKQLLRQSLHAALTVDEVAAILEQLRLPREWVSATSDRHWTVSGRMPL